MSDHKLTKSSKGATTRATILEKARIMYNEHGIDLKIDEIVQLIGCNKSSLTNHFPNKEKLLAAIATEYDQQVSKIVIENGYEHFQDLQTSVNFYQKLMDLQFEYRAAILFTINSTFNDIDYKTQIIKSYNLRLAMFKSQLKKFQTNGILVSTILEKEYFEIFVVQYFTMSIHWLSYFEMYSTDINLKKTKETYLKSIFHLYLPYLTKKGKTQFDQINFKLG